MFQQIPSLFGFRRIVMLAMFASVVNQWGSVSAQGQRKSYDKSTVSLYQRPDLQGVTRPLYDALLRPLAQGTVLELYVEEGEYVKAGQALVRLNDKIAVAAVNVARAATEKVAGTKLDDLLIQQAKSQFERTQTAFQQRAASQFELDAKKNRWMQAITQKDDRLEQLVAAQAELELAKAQLASLTLVAPFDGQVIQCFARTGNTIDPQSSAIRIATMDMLVVEMHLPVRWFGKVRENEFYPLQAADPVNRVLNAQLVFAAPVIEPTSGTFRTVFHIKNHDRKLPAGFQVWFVAKDDTATNVSQTSHSR